MLEVTQEALERVAGYFAGKEPSPIRIYLTEGS